MERKSASCMCQIAGSDLDEEVVSPCAASHCWGKVPEQFLQMSEHILEDARDSLRADCSAHETTVKLAFKQGVFTSFRRPYRMPSYLERLEEASLKAST